MKLKFWLKSPITRLVWPIGWRCFGLLGGFRDGRFNGTMRNVVGPTPHPCCHGNDIWPRRGDVSLFLFLHVQSLKTYQLYHGEWQQAEAKLRHAENQKTKLERQQSAGSGGVTAAKSALSRRFRNFEKLSEKVGSSTIIFITIQPLIFFLYWRFGNACCLPQNGLDNFSLPLDVAANSLSWIWESW